MSRRHPFLELWLARMREILREPEIVFWVFGFPVLLALGLGIAFRNKPPGEVAVGVLAGPGAESAMAALTPERGFQAKLVQPEQAGLELRLGKVDLVVAPGDTSEYRFDPTRPESVFARQRVDDALQRAAGRTDPLAVREALVTEPGARYIDFLIPGLLGMNIMSGGLWGIGFALVDMRSRKLLKRLLATPMRRTHFLGALMASRMVLVFGEILALLGMGWIAFDLVLRGSLVQVVLLSFLGAFCFAGIGLLVASRARKVETVSGLMNLVMLPMFVLSGVFFSASRFPDAVQPIVRALPLTALTTRCAP
jgi:ABC-type Na+ efflux pump permease subunit